VLRTQNVLFHAALQIWIRLFDAYIQIFMLCFPQIKNSKSNQYLLEHCKIWTETSHDNRKALCLFVITILILFFIFGPYYGEGMDPENWNGYAQYCWQLFPLVHKKRSIIASF